MRLRARKLICFRFRRQYNCIMSQAFATESEILTDMISPESATLEPEAARAILKWRFSEKSVARMNWLAERNCGGKITSEEREELERFLRVSSLVNLAQAKARLSLHQAKAD